MSSTADAPPAGHPATRPGHRPVGPPRVARRTAVAVAVALLTTGCVGPMLSYQSYRDKVYQTVRQIAGAMASARFAAELDLSGRMALAMTDSVVSDAESDASDAQQILVSRQPPDAPSLALRKRVDQPISDSVNALTDLRIAVRRDSTAGIRSAVAELDHARGELQRIDPALS